MLLVVLAVGCDAPEEPGQPPASEPVARERRAQEKLRERLTLDARPGPEHALLDALAGTWAMEGEWTLFPGKAPLAVERTFENTWIMGGRILESQGIERGEVTSKVFYGYDVQRREYYAVGVNAMTTQYTLEHGAYDTATRTLRLAGVELDPKTGEEVRYERQIRIDGDDHHVITIILHRPELGDTRDMVMRFSRATP